MPRAAGGVSAAYAGGRVVAIGGEGTTDVSDAVQAYDIQHEKWSSLPALPTARHGVAAGGHRDMVYAIGGATAVGHLGSTKEAEVLDLSGKPAPAQATASLAWRELAGCAVQAPVRGRDRDGGQGLALWRNRRRWQRDHRDRGLRPRHQHLDTGTRAASAVAPRRGGDLQGRRGGDRRFHSGRGADVRAVGSRVRPARGLVGGAAVAESPRAAAAAAVVGDKIVVVGGQADGKLVPQTEVFDGERWTDVADMPTPREHLGAASDGRYLYAVGGRELTAAKNLPALERYDPASDSWTKLDDMPKNVGSVGVAFVGGLVVAVGGEGATRPFDAVQAFDVKVEPVVAAPRAAGPAPRSRRDRTRRLPLRHRRRHRCRPRQSHGCGRRARPRLAARRGPSGSASAPWVEPCPM